jgi:hypothetical protein
LEIFKGVEIPKYAEANIGKHKVDSAQRGLEPASGICRAYMHNGA